jgi:hypothetical protein
MHHCYEDVLLLLSHKNFYSFDYFDFVQYIIDIKVKIEISGLLVILNTPCIKLDVKWKPASRHYSKLVATYNKDKFALTITTLFQNQ